jgi:Eco57I restriction-modification methylase
LYGKLKLETMTTEQKNIYEDLIEGMIIDGINGMTPELKKMIKTAPIEQQRSMILEILEENNPEHRILVGEIKKLIKRGIVGEMDYIKKVVQMLREYVKVSDVEVKKFGEIMTPIELVEEMLDTLPPTVWMSPNLKWLDPCNGVGTFISVVVQRLMKGLEWTIPNEEARYKHIIENMIYICELQPKNIFLYLYAFDPENRYALNIHNGSFLDKGFNDRMGEWGIEKFDVIVMNPPYQEQKEGNRKTQTLWDKFIFKTIENLNEGGYLTAVHPSGWRNVDGMFKDIQKLLRSKQILYLEFHNEKDGLKTFGAETRYDFYCLQNVSCTLNTKVKCQDGKIERVDISKLEFIPNGMFDLFKKCLPKNGEDVVKILRDSSYHTQRPHMSKVQTDEFKYPCVYTVKKGDNKTLWYSNSNKNGHFNIPKFIWSNFRISSGGTIIDINGEYGLTQFAYAIIDSPENLSHIKKAFDSELFRELMENCSFSYLSINPKPISLFRKDFWMDFI